MTETEDAELRKAVRRLNARAWGITGALVLGLGLFMATNILLLQGAPEGQPVGPTLGRLSYFLPGYSVTFVGSLIGFVYMFVLGYAVGRAVGTLYNKMVEGFPT
jgi:tetrahydromethanopterin S-methyltransferase subunit G